MRGWRTVFKFTFARATGGKGFLMATVGVALLMFVILFGSNIIFSVNSDKEDTGIESIKTVYVSNETEVENVDYTLMPTVKTEYKDVTFTSIDSSKVDDQKAQLTKDGSEVIVQITFKEDGYNLGVLAAEDSVISKSDLETLGTDMSKIFESFKAADIGLTPDQLVQTSSYVDYQVVKAGESAKSIGARLFEMFAPMLIYLLLYVMLIVYGQSISKSIIAEKSSKVMELLLTSIKPYAVVTGKILAMITVAIIQFVSWIAGGVLGFIIGDMVAKNINPSYENALVSIINAIKDSSGGEAFSIPMAIGAVLIILLGFIFYCVFSGLVASNVSKPEEVTNTDSLFQLPVVFSFLAVYMLPLMSAGKIMNILRYIPFTGAFLLPSDLLIGKISIGSAIVPILIIVAVTVIMVYATGKIYKKKIF